MGIFAAEEDVFPDCLGLDSRNSMVGSSSGAFPAITGAPHDEQNRPASDTSEPHETQVGINRSA